MNRILVILLCLGFVFSGASAQIILTQSTYPSSVLGTDTLKMTVYSTAFPSLLPMAGGLWDLSTVTDSTPQFYKCHLPDAIHQYADSNDYSIIGYYYRGNAQCDVAASGILEFGVNVKEAKYSLTTLTSGSTDTLIIVSQNMLYSAPLTKIAFPATYNSSWSSYYSADIAIDLSVSALSYSHAPGFIRRYTTRKDTVTGWGKMRVKDVVGVPSDSFHVLQVQTSITTLDSFFLNGLPFTGALLAMLHLHQGMEDTVYEQNYYQPQEIVPLAEVTFSDAGYTQPQKAVTHVKRMIGTTASKSNVLVNDYCIYPNPVKSPFVTVTIPDNRKMQTAYSLIDASGKVIAAGKLYTEGSAAEIKLPSNITPGTYYLRLKETDAVLSLQIIK